MKYPLQTALFDIEIKGKGADISEWGTFKDSLRAPVHGWFTYPAGFSYKAVEHSLEQVSLKKGKSIIYDPFMGSGTTNIVAKSMGYNSIGVEAHPFVYRIAKSKMNWDVNFKKLCRLLELIKNNLSKIERPNKLDDFLNNEFPELIPKCFLPETLFELFVIRDSILQLEQDESTTELLRTALICSLRDVSIAATGWPYIAPNKIKVTSMSKRGWETYRNRVLKMHSDLVEIKRKATVNSTEHLLVNGDSRNTIGQIEDERADHIFTSPPYLNNFDYADRTRLELYFMGEAKNWGDISEKVRTKLMTSATTQINRGNAKYQFLDSFKTECPVQFSFLNDAVRQLSDLRVTKGGKKSYDLMVVGYFNDMYQIIKDNFRILKPGSKALYILGDSAPYGIHIPTDELIGQIGVAIGFNSYQIQVLRERGGKWANNPQRHNVMLKESVVILEK
jgi:DNA modification methylase